MCASRKHLVNLAAALAAPAVMLTSAAAGSAGGVALGEARGGVTDGAFVTAPPDYAYVVEREAGSFLDCGDGMDARATDADGRDLAALNCGVTLTETLAIPAAARSARIIVHY